MSAHDRQTEETAAPASPPGGRRYRLLLALAAAAVFWERLWPRLWPAACVVGAFVAIALLDVLPRLPGWAHAAVLLGFIAALAVALLRTRPALRPVGRTTARARLERDSALADRPLEALEDRLAGGRGDPLAEALWQRHRRRMAGALGRLRVAPPATDIARHEPWGVRAGVLLLLVVALSAGRQDPGARLLRALDLATGGGRAPLVELWITPPGYTRAAPLFLTTATALEAADEVAVPQGSAVLARVGGVRRAPELRIGESTTPFAAIAETEAERAWRGEATVRDGERIAVDAGLRTLASWPIRVIPDAPPTIAFAEPPRAEGNGLLAVPFAAADDYGVVEASAVIRPAPGEEPGAAAEAVDVDEIRVSLPLAAPGAGEARGTGVFDLAAHPLAGRPVEVRLEAKDAAGQTAAGDAVGMLLPERDFTHPVARAVAAERKRLFRADDAVRTVVATSLAVIAGRPEHYAHDSVVTLALSVAAGRLRLDRSPGAVASVRDLLWDTALRIEQGDVPFAERQLDEARQRLVDALRNGASESEIERLMDELQQALDRYLAAAAELARRGQEAAPLDRQAQVLRSEDLRDLVETARQMARAGGREGAMRMLAELQRALDDLRSGLRAGADAEELREANELLGDLRELTERQQSLLDETFQKLRRGERGEAQPPRRPGERGERGEAQQGEARKRSQADQEAIRGELGELMRRMGEFLGEIPAPMGQAEQAMRSAAEALGRGRPADAVPAQTRAVDALSRALEQSGQAMAERFGGMIGVGGPGEDDGGSDAFGRPADGTRGTATGGLEIPEAAELHRAQQILDELRRRAAERSRPRDELDYIQRLLQRF